MAPDTEVQVTGGGSTDCGNGWDPVRHDGDPRSRWLAGRTVAPADDPDGEAPDVVERSPPWLTAVPVTSERRRDTSAYSGDSAVEHATTVDTGTVVQESLTRAVGTRLGGCRPVRHLQEPRETTPVGRQDIV